MIHVMSGLAKFMDTTETAWWVAASKALVAWLGQPAIEDLRTLHINCLERVTFGQPQIVDRARPSAGSIRPGWEERQACLDSGYREGSTHPGECVKGRSRLRVGEEGCLQDDAQTRTCCAWRAAPTRR